VILILHQLYQLVFMHVGDVLISSVIEFCGLNKSLGSEILAAGYVALNDVELILCDLSTPCDKSLSVC